MESNKSSSAAAPVAKTKIRRTKRYTPPAHYIFKINSFSQLAKIAKKSENDSYESDEFEAAGYKWKLILYPNGNGRRNGKGHISMYLASTDKQAISCGCHVNALTSFFVYDHIREKYLTIQDGKVKRYNVLRTQHGFDQLLLLKKFKDSTKGYLVDDCCVFGAEVHVIKGTRHGQEFCVIEDPPHGSFTWKINKFSTLKDKAHHSEVFNVGGYNWTLMLFPKGDLDDKDECLSVYLHLEDGGEIHSQGVYAEAKVLVKDQINGMHREGKVGEDWFRSSGCSAWGNADFMLLSDVHDTSNGYIVNDTLVLEAIITLVSAVKKLS